MQHGRPHEESANGANRHNDCSGLTHDRGANAYLTAGSGIPVETLRIRSRICISQIAELLLGYYSASSKVDDSSTASPFIEVGLDGFAAEMVGGDPQSGEPIVSEQR